MRLMIHLHPYPALFIDKYYIRPSGSLGFANDEFIMSFDAL